MHKRIQNICIFAFVIVPVSLLCNLNGYAALPSMKSKKAEITEDGPHTHTANIANLSQAKPTEYMNTTPLLLPNHTATMLETTIVPNLPTTPTPTRPPPQTMMTMTTTTIATTTSTTAANPGNFNFNPIMRGFKAKISREDSTFKTPEQIMQHTQNFMPNDVLELQHEANVGFEKVKLKIKTINMPANKRRDSITDFTGKLLAEQDGVITEIEEKFRFDELAATTKKSSELNTEETGSGSGMHSKLTTTTTSLLKRPEEISNKKVGKVTMSVNHHIRAATLGGSTDFIDRRVKKSFEFPINRTHIDFANTKFHANPNEPPMGKGFTAGSTTAMEGNAAMQTKFSPTKFYNAKDLCKELFQPIKLFNSEKGSEASREANIANTKVQRNSPIICSGGTASVAPTRPATTTSTTTVAKTTSHATTTETLRAATINQQLNYRLSESVTKVATAKMKSHIFDKSLHRDQLFFQSAYLPKVPKIQTATTSTTTTAPPASTKTSLSNTEEDGDSDITSTFNSIPMNSVTTVASTSTNAYAQAEELLVSITTQPNSTSLQKTVVSKLFTASNISHRSSKPAKASIRSNGRPRVLSPLQEKINSLECEIQNVPHDSHLWRGNETHELLLPEELLDCKSTDDCSAHATSWEGEAEIQSGDILIVEINDEELLMQNERNDTNSAHAMQVYQVTRSGHEHCDVTEGILLDITPLVVDGRKLVTLYEKDLTEGVNLLIVVSELWGSQCVRLKVTTKTDNCGENADCSGKGICYSNPTLEEYECQCCSGFVGPHCEEIDACTPSPCTNNGICVDLSQGHEGNSYQCLCPYGYTGKNCQYESEPCNPAECMNGGTCVGNASNFRCECTPGYTGPLCQHSLNECESSPCVHGICVDQEDGFRCFCQPGFSGEICNIEYNECESNPCQNDGECIDHIGSYECRCTKGYTGNRCQIKVDLCASKPCPERYHCVDHGNDYTCECAKTPNGVDCNYSPRMACNVNPCAHGGTCWSSGDSFYCACRPGFTGTMCEDEFIVETVVSSSEFMLDDTGTRSFNDKPFGSPVGLKTTINFHNAYFAAGVLAAAIFIGSIVVLICHCKVNQTYRKFSHRTTTFFPFFGFGRRPKLQGKLNKHWLSGKGFASSGNTFRSTSMSRANLLIPNGSQYTTTTTATTNHHHNQKQPQQGEGQLTERTYHQSHLAMSIDNDMCYSVDFSESLQHSPLIQ